MTKEKTKVTWSGEYDSIGQKIPEIKVKPINRKEKTYAKNKSNRHSLQTIRG